MTIALRAEASRAVVVLDGVDRVAFNEDGSMELLTPAAGTPTGNDVTTAGQLGFGKMYESIKQTMTIAGLLTLPHGLGAVPKLIDFAAICKTADAGYSVGDIIKLSPATDSSRGPQAYQDATNIYIRFGQVAVGAPLDKTTGASTNMIPANWRLIVRAWA